MLVGGACVDLWTSQLQIRNMNTLALRWSVAGALVALVAVNLVEAWTETRVLESSRHAHGALQASATHPVPNWPSPVTPSPLATPNEAGFVLAAEASVDAVVHVQTASLVADPSNPWLSMFGMATGRIAQGSGSGVVLDRDGLIVTNHHVIDGAREVRVNTSDGASYPATVLGSDPSTDLAILKIQPDRPLKALPLGNSDAVRVGEWVLAVGNPLNLTSTVTAGIVSAKGRNIRLLEPDATRDVFPVESFLQTDAAVNPGNSGGALVNLKGELIGINTAIASQTGSYAGYSFAIPSSIVAKVARDLNEFGRVQRAYLGVAVDATNQGVRVASTSEGGGAAEAGIRAGDRILAVNDFEVKTFPSLQEQLSKHRPGDVVAVRTLRGDVTRTVDVTLTNRHGDTKLLPSHAPKPPSGSTEEPTLEGTSAPSEAPWQAAWGVVLREVPQGTCQRLGIRGGLMTTELRQGEWSRQGLGKGFILLRVDGAPVSSLSDLRKALERAADGNEEGVLLEGMYTNGQRAYAGVAVPEELLQPHK
jgi:serine protease Do